MAAWSPAQAIIIMYIDVCKDNAFDQQPSEAWSPESVTGQGGWKDFVSSALLGKASSHLTLICPTLRRQEIKGTALWRCLWLKRLPLHCFKVKWDESGSPSLWFGWHWFGWHCKPLPTRLHHPGVLWGMTCDRRSSASESLVCWA